ncbi:MAG: phosphohistidine phosphatase SixA [Candidatus Zipacnadales bacterium]
MKLLFFRHGKAEQFAANGSDAGRRLTEQGRNDSTLTARAVLHSGIKPEWIVHSPLIRAQETAVLAAELLKPPRGLCEDRRLACGAGMAEVKAIVEEYGGQCLMLVGHNPDFSCLVGQLIGGAQIDMKTAAIACVELTAVEPGAGVLEWLVIPNLVE